MRTNGPCTSRGGPRDAVSAVVLGRVRGVAGGCERAPGAFHRMLRVVRLRGMVNRLPAERGAR